MKIKILYISGSPRKKSNTDFLLKLALSITGGEFLKLVDHEIEPCKECWSCVKLNKCIIEDDMTNKIIPKLLESNCIILGSPVFFNNVTAQMKSFIDRTWSIRSKLKNKIGGSIVVGRRYGLESAITAMNAFFLKHEMIIGSRGVSGIAFNAENIKDDEEAINATKKLASRILELGKLTLKD
ncbi:MAG: flavodoxin family protein [Candidatus Helarchaeota archaeon]